MGENFDGQNRGTDIKIKDMRYWIHSPVAVMRESPKEGAKVVSQALFSEEVKVLNRAKGWAQIQTPDGYEGWVEEGCFVQREEPYQGDLSVTRLKAHLYGEADTEFGPLLSLPYGSQLELLQEVDPRWLRALLPDGRIVFIQKGDVASEPFDLISFSKKFLGLPYTWGGRSSFGYDCSGYVQMIYSHLGIQLPRDARLQIADPRGKEVPIDQLAPGDLIFWGKSEREIRHVGMFLEKDQFIHTSSRENKPYLRVSRLTDLEWSGNEGVFYPYRAARRFFS